MVKFLSIVAVLFYSSLVTAGPPTWIITPTSVPVDSPLALLGLGTAVAFIAARILRNRSK